MHIKVSFVDVLIIQRKLKAFLKFYQNNFKLLLKVFLSDFINKDYSIFEV